MKTVQSGATYFFASSLFALAGAIIYFSVQIAKIVDEVPALLTSINQTNENLAPVINEVAEIRKQIPGIVNEVAATRKQIPSILKEVTQVREQLPAILEEVRQVRELVPPIMEEVKQLRIIVPDILTEVAATREAIPLMLDKGETMIANAQKAGEKASQGAVTGFFKGIVTAPFRLIGGMGAMLFSVGGEVENELDEEDLKQLDLIGSEILSSDTVGEREDWNNVEEGLSGRLTLQSIDITDGQTCKNIRVQLWEHEKSTFDKVSVMCLDSEGNWSKKE